MTLPSLRPANAGGDYDLAVIGAGSAGFSAAITAAEQGAKVVLIGHGMIGGSCVNVGCVPSKTMIRAAQGLHHTLRLRHFAGLDGQATVSDWPALIAQKNALVRDLRQAKYIDVLPAYNNIAYLEGRARLHDGGITLDGAPLGAAKTIIATGASAHVPAIAGLDSIDWLTSTTALELLALPESLLVIGGGYIGCELAQMFSRMGVRVTIVCRSRLLPEGEPEISAALAEYFSAEGIIVRTGRTYGEIKSTDGGVALNVTHHGTVETIQATRILVATGRRPNTADMGLEDAGIELSANGGIVVDDRLATTRDGIYAAGDVTGRDMFVYMAAYGARLAAHNALNGNSRRYDASAMPAVVFTDPQVASVGLTQAAAIAAGHETRISILALEHVPRALAARDTRGLIKLVADGPTGRLLGAHIMAPEGADAIQTAALAIRQGLTYQDLADMIFPYLTTVEGLKLAAQTFDKDVTTLSCCAG
jgi:mercury(II) reductase